MKYLSIKDFKDEGQSIKLKGVSIVKFYAPWCGYCVKSQPQYEALDAAAGKKINVCMFNCVENADFLKVINSGLHGYKVEGYPTHVIFVKGQYYEVYEGPRDAKPMLNYLLQIATSH